MSGESGLVRTMSDDPAKKDQGKGDGTGTAPDADKTGSGSATAMPFSELMGHIDSRIESAVRKVVGGKSEGGSTDKTVQETPESVAQQVRTELAKLNSEESAAKKEADREVTITQLQEQVSKLSENAPTQTVSKLTQFMWGGKKKKDA